MKKKILFAALIGAVVMFFSSCGDNTTIYATWADAIGNQIMMNDQLQYKARIYDSNTGNFIDKNGEFVIYINTIIFIDSDNRRSPAEWDLVGKVLYLKFEDENGVQKGLTLFKIGEAEKTGGGK